MMSLSSVRTSAHLAPARLEWRSGPSAALRPGEPLRVTLKLVPLAAAGLHDLSLRLEGDDGGPLLHESLLSELLLSEPGRLALGTPLEIELAFPLCLAPGHYRLAAEVLGGASSRHAVRSDFAFSIRPEPATRVRGLLALVPEIRVAELPVEAGGRSAGSVFPAQVHFTDPAIAPHLRGFHAVERNEAGGYRWTTGEARFPLRIDRPVLRLRLLATSPEGNPAPRILRVSLDGEMVGEKTLVGGAQELVFPLPERLADGRVATVTLQIPEWTPARIISGSADRRALGVAIVSAGAGA